jgi:hypothetical protein
MTKANDSVDITVVSGTPIATHTVDAKGHQVMMLATRTGA